MSSRVHHTRDIKGKLVRGRNKRLSQIRRMAELAARQDQMFEVQKRVRSFGNRTEPVARTRAAR